MNGLRRILGSLSETSRLVITLAVLVVVVLYMLDVRLRAQVVRSAFPDLADRYYLPPPAYLKVASLGYREAAADLIWIATVQHASDRRPVAGRVFPWLERYLDSVIALNPYMLKLYLWADGTITYGRGRLDNDEWWRAIHYLELGHRRFPRNWEILFKLASAYTELRTKDPAQRTRWMRRAADYLWKAHLVGGGPAWLGSLAARYWSDEGQWRLAYRRTLEEFKRTEDPQVRREMADRLASLLMGSARGQTLVDSLARFALPPTGNPNRLGLLLVSEALHHERAAMESKRQVAFVQAQKEAFDRAHRRCLPYGSADLFALLGPCQTPAIDPGKPEAYWRGRSVLPPPPAEETEGASAPRSAPADQNEDAPVPPAQVSGAASRSKAPARRSARSLPSARAAPAPGGAGARP